MRLWTLIEFSLVAFEGKMRHDFRRMPSWMCNDIVLRTTFWYLIPDDNEHLINVGNMLTPVRHDRDNFIRVNEDNILPKMRNNFEKRTYGDAGFHTAGSVDPEHTPYDLLSVIVL